MAKLDHFELVLTAIDYIEKNLKEPISVQDVCSQIPLSPWQFQRLFRAIVQDSIGSYLRGRRLTCSADILVKSQNRILDIAIEFQFGSQEAFTRAFKSQYRVPPGTIRENPDSVKLYKKPQLTRDMLSHFQDGVQSVPSIRELGPLSLVGITTSITSYLGENPNFEKNLPEFWMEFDGLKRAQRINMDLPNYGVALSNSESMFEENLTYFAGIPASGDTTPSGMVSFHIDKRLYAVFENKGLCDKSLSTIAYIYGTWLPGSEYQRAKGFDFEIFDHRYSMGDPQSVSLYCLPIERPL